VNHWQTLQQNYRTSYKQICWPHTSNILNIIFHRISGAYFWLLNFNKKLLKERNLLEIFVKEQCFEMHCFDNTKWKEFSSVMDRPMFPNMSKTFCHLGRLGTWNLIAVFSKVFTEQCLLFDELKMSGLKKNTQCCIKCVWFSKGLSQIYRLLQQMSGKLISFSTIRLNLYLFQFANVRYQLQYTITDLVVVAKHCNTIVAKHCNTILDPATCTHVGQPTQQYF